MLKKSRILLACIMVLSVLFTGCGNTKSSSSSNDDSSSQSQKPVTIKFYGADAQYNKDIIAGFNKIEPNITVQIVPVDFTNAETIIKTGISSGNPVDVSFFWGTQINDFVSSKMATDLTPYLTANNSQWKNTFIPKYIDAGKVNGKYYAVSYQPVIETMYYNKDLFSKYNVQVPVTWDDLLAACQTFKTNGVSGIGDWSGQQHQMLVFAYQIMANKGKLADVTAGKVAFTGKTEAPGLRDCLTKIKTLYDKGYWYPGEGALTAKIDQVQAAFYQQKIAMLFDSGSNVGTYEKNAKFSIGVMKFPLVSKDSKYGVNVVTNALFVPANAAHKAEAVKFIKYYTSEAGQTVTMGTGRLPSVASMQSKIADPLMQDLMKTTDGSNVVSYTHLQNLSPEISSYITNELVSSVCSGTSIDTALQKLEDLRQKAIAKK